MDLFHGPAVVGEIAGQMIEHAWMCWTFALRAEVFLRGDDAFAKHFGPPAVDRDTADEWVVAVGHPLGESESIWGQLVGGGVEHARRAGIDCSTFV